MIRLAVAVVALLIVPSAASAAEVRIEGTTLVYAADPGEENRLAVGDTSPDTFLIQTSAPTRVMAPCTQEGPLIRCPAAGLTLARFELGDGNDSLQENDTQGARSQVPYVVAAGDGDDFVAGSPFGDVVDGGAGDDNLALGVGDDQAVGGAGTDQLNGGAGRDALDGGVGNDRLIGGEEDDQLETGTGRDFAVGDEGDDRIDMRNGEKDGSGADDIECGDGAGDTIALDPSDQVLEYRQPNGRIWLVLTCERVEGQTKAPKPKHVVLFTRPRLTAQIDSNVALPTMITVEVFVRGKLIAKSTAKRTGPRTTFTVKRTAAGRRMHGFFIPGKVRATIRDSAGRTSSKTVKRILTQL